MSNTPLELSTIAPERETALLKTPANPGGLRPDGEPYELLSPAELSLVQLNELTKTQAAVARLWEKEPAKAEEQLNTLVGRVVIDAPAADVKELPAMMKMNLMRLFSLGVTEQMTATTAAPEKAPED